ncbi:MAG TPA: ABC transporter substrate-binding protein [Actinophytocola sp.]|uniref:ABC transporter substrate-binding protein n=1 Tax=Actinophytocola sp. TaxID=1872138 RepID=UPI002DDD3B3A|nr:ABC transporter substrate-binding protein [Actinophytocola sp.]HEV2784358.1 ABC transporter substrate-binding protein [Actinophytocola sp.]
MNPCRRTISLLAAVVLAGAACTPGGNQNDAGAAPAGQEASGSIEFWHFFTEREAKAIEDVLADFKAKHPKVDVRVVAGQDDPKMLQAISSGQGPDVGLSYSTDIVGKFCSSGAWRDLKSYVERDKVDLGQLPETVRSYTEYQGKRCAMPFLADTYGLYYNKKLLAEAGYTQPPRTTSELAEMAKKITKRAADGSIEVAGFVPLVNAYEYDPSHVGPSWDLQWLTGDEKSAIGADPDWPAMLRWNKELVDWYGFDALQTFTAGFGDEFSADNAFHKGKIAMMVDGEFRIAFLRDQAPDVEFGTAPFPVPDGKQDRYGAGYVTGNVIGISNNSKNPEAAWALIRYLTTDTEAIVKLSNLIKNVPTTRDALASSTLEADKDFQVFLDIFKHPATATTPPNASGPKYIELAEEFVDAYQSGKAPDLRAGLSELDTRINQALELGR